MLKIVNWNIRHGKGRDRVINIDRIAETLKELNADVYTIQEVDEKSIRSGKIDQPRHLSEALSMNHYFTPISFVKSGRYGIVTLTNLHVLNKRDLVLTKRSENHSAQMLTLTKSDKILSLVNLHAPWKINEAYWQGFLKCVDTSSTIMSGDFNLYPNTPLIQDFKSSLNSINESSTYQDGTVLDYTFSPYPIISQQVIPTRFSDHNILVTEIDC
jgi:endonuclease/exonuclease/phosphatase family metal-dependent hydrolase